MIRPPNDERQRLQALAQRRGLLVGYNSDGTVQILRETRQELPLLEWLGAEGCWRESTKSVRAFDRLFQGPFEEARGWLLARPEVRHAAV